MTTYSDLIEDTRQHLMTGQPDRINLLDAAIDDSQDTLTLRYENKGISTGSFVVIDIEECHVLDVSTTGATTTLTIVRGYNGSVPAAHNAGAIIYSNPQFSSFRIAKRLNTALNNLSAEGLFRILNVPLDGNSTRAGYDLGNLPYFQAIWRVRYSDAGSSMGWHVLRAHEYHVDPTPDPTMFPGGTAMFVDYAIPSGRDIRLSYRAGFANLVNLTDDVATVSGLHAQAHDLPPLYAAITLLAGREVKRSFLNRQPEPRRQEEVPPGSANQSMQPILKLYYERIDKEMLRLKRLYPTAI